MRTWLWILLGLMLFVAVVFGAFWYGMTLIQDAEVRGVPLP